LSKKKGIAKRPPEGLVLDSSVAAAWCFADEQDEYPQSVLDALTDTAAAVPSLWHLEMANTFLIGERRGRSTRADTVQWLSFLGSLPIVTDGETTRHAWQDTLALARDRALTAYDAAYLELALRRGLPLATLDDKLRAAAQAVGVPLHGLQ
jgi:predicted nucleic acid-binding protein